MGKLTRPLWWSEVHRGSADSWPGSDWKLSCVSLPCTHAPHSSCWTMSLLGCTHNGEEARPPPSGLRRGTSNSLMAVTGPSGVGGSCGVRVGWGGVLPGSPLGGAKDPRLSLIEANLPTT